MLIAARKNTDISQSNDPKEAIRSAAGDLSGIKISLNNVLIGTYIRPEKTAGGIIRPTNNVDEDEFQGKVGLILKMGAQAFDEEFWGEKNFAKVGDWVVYRIGDAFSHHMNRTACRLIRDDQVKMVTDDPEKVL